MKYDQNIEDMYKEAVVLCMEEGKASVSFIQRKLRVGYAIGALILDMMEERGVVGESNGAKPREIINQTK